MPLEDHSSTFGVPDRIGRFVVDRPLGRGGMSRTFRCTLEGVGGFRKLLLLKMLAPEHAHDERFRKMFLDEAHLSAHLVHPNIAQVFEVGEELGTPWLAMEYVAGPDLARVSKRLRTEGVRHCGHAARLFADVCRGLDCAHRLRGDDGRRMGVVHRDVSLGNVVVSPDGVAKLIDFGIAWSRVKANTTDVGVLKGKLHYMAPEQLTDAVDHRLDIYQVGVCLYWLTLGRPPFHHRDPVHLWRLRLEGRLTPPSRLRPEYPSELEAIVLRALDRDPARRFQRAGDLADALEAFASRAGPWRSTARHAGVWVQGLFSPQEREEFRNCTPVPALAEPEEDLPPLEDYATADRSQSTLSVGLASEDDQTTSVVPAPSPPGRTAPAATVRLPPGPLLLSGLVGACGALLMGALVLKGLGVL